MAFDRDRDWSKHTADEFRKGRIRSLQAAKRAAISANFVTGDEHWDHFLSVVTARLEQVKQELETASEQLKTSDNFTPDSLILQKLAVRLAHREIQALEWVMGLPKALMEQGDLAKQLLENIEQSTH